MTKTFSTPDAEMFDHELSQRLNELTATDEIEKYFLSNIRFVINHRITKFIYFLVATKV